MDTEYTTVGLLAFEQPLGEWREYDTTSRVHVLRYEPNNAISIIEKLFKKGVTGVLLLSSDNGQVCIDNIICFEGSKIVREGALEESINKLAGIIRGHKETFLQLDERVKKKIMEAYDLAEKVENGQ